jgi:hypothetical protein
MKRLFLFNSLVIIATIMGCASHIQDLRQYKMDCYEKKLLVIKNDPLYRNIISQFIDTFKIMRNDKNNFGAPEIVTNHIDSAIFYNRNRTGCLLIVLQKDNSDFVFATARIVIGKLQNHKWVFKPNMDYYYDNDFYKLYSERSFDNISKIARYSVLTTGKFHENECEIDESYWFGQ